MSELISEVADVRSNPAAIQRVVTNALNSAIDGEYDLVDPSNPFVFLLEASVATAAAGIRQSQALDRKRYAVLSQSEEDLYRHMSDIDYANRFATPSHVTLTLMISLDELKKRAVIYKNGISKVIIPRYSEFTVEGMAFTTQYPIEIRVMSHGGIQVVYDVDVVDELYILDSNILDWDLVKMSAAAQDLAGMTMLRINIPVNQFKIDTYYDSLSPTVGFNKTYSFNDQYYYCRVYVSKSTTEWEEIKTTHSDQIYDPTTPTAVLKVVEDKLSVKIPQIYFTTSLISRSIRIDVYTTKGTVSTSLERYQPSNFSVKWRDLAKTDNPYVKPLQTISTITIYSTDRVSGGSDKLSFEELRSRVINNSLGPINIPITPKQLSAKLDTMGYDVVTHIDDITNRTYLAIRDVPNPDTSLLKSSIGASVSTYSASIADTILSGTVRDNTDRITIESGTIFEYVNGAVELVDDATITTIDAASSDVKAQYINEARYLYSPFHYVLDTTGSAFEMRAYYLDSPSIVAKRFIDENQTAQLMVSTNDYAISKTSTGYKLVVTTISGDEFKSLTNAQVHAQLSFIPENDITRAYLNGTVLGRDSNNEFIIEFNLDSNFDLDSNDQLLLSTFQQFLDGTLPIPSLLTQELDIIYSVTEYTVVGLESSDIDDKLGTFLLPANPVGVIHEQFKVEFGKALTGLWRRSRSVVDQQYEVYATDVPATYSEDVYATDATGTIEMTIDPVLHTASYTILHNVGDPVLDGNSNPIIAHTAGEIKLDANGDPIPLGVRYIVRNVDLFLLEGAFKYADEQVIVDYTKETIETIVHWVASDIDTLSQKMLEQTDIWYYPTSTIGDIPVYVLDNTPTTLQSEQSFTVEYYLTSTAYNDLNLRDTLKTIAIESVANGLANKTVSMADIAAAIKDLVDAHVIDVVVSGLGGAEYNYDLVTVRDASNKLNLKKSLMTLSDGRLTVQDDVTVKFVNHVKS